MSDPNSNSAPRGAREPGPSVSDPQPQEPPFPNEPEPTPPTPAEPNPVTPQEPQPDAPETPSPSEPTPSEPYPGAPVPDAPGTPQPTPGSPEPAPSSPEPDAPGPFEPGTPAASASNSRAGATGAHAHGAEADARWNDPGLSDTRAVPSDADTASHDSHPFTDAYGSESSDEHRLTPSEPAAETAAVSHDSGNDEQTERLARAEAARADAGGADTDRTDADSGDARTERIARSDADRDDDRSDTSRYVQAQPEPKRRGNRGFGILIGILQAIIFAALFYGALLLVRLLTGQDLDFIGLLISPMFLITVGMFFIGLVIVSLLVNRAGWWSWILLGLLVAAFAYVGAVGGSLVQDAMSVPSNRVREYLLDNLLTWPSVIAFLLGREVPIWFGAWVAARGRRVTERNITEHDEYERQRDEGSVDARR